MWQTTKVSIIYELFTALYHELNRIVSDNISNSSAWMKWDDYKKIEQMLNATGWWITFINLLMLCDTSNPTSVILTNFITVYAWNNNRNDSDVKIEL